METIGDRLKRLRKSKNLTQEQAAAQVGLTRSTLSNYEINRRTPHLKELERFAVFYGVNIDYFSVSTQDVAFDLLSRARDVLTSPFVSYEDKEKLYHELMRLFYTLEKEKDGK